MSLPVSSEETTASCNTKVQYKTKAWMYHFYLISTTRKLIFSEGRGGGKGMGNKRQHPLIWNNRTIKAQTQTNGQKDRMKKTFAVKGLCDTMVRVLIFHNKSLPPSTNSNQFELSQLDAGTTFCLWTHNASCP